MCLVKLRDVSLGYGRQPVLEHVTLDLERGEFIALLGPNGAGKTTLLRGIVGLLPVLTGTIDYDKLIPLLPKNCLFVFEMSPRRTKEEITESLRKWKERFGE